MPALHVIAEGVARPKLQCFKCQTLAAHARFPGRNFPTRRDLAPGPASAAADGWLINHKGQNLFYTEVFDASRNAADPCFYRNDTRIKE